MKRLHPPFRSSSVAGLTITEVALVIAIISIVFALSHVALRILNQLKYQQRLTEVQGEVKPLMAKLVQEIRNAKCLMSDNSNALRMRSYDYEGLGYIDTNLFLDVNDAPPWGEQTTGAGREKMTDYIVIDESVGNVLQAFGIMETPPFLLKRTRWYPSPWDLDLYPAPNCTFNDRFGNPVEYYCETFLQGLIEPSVGTDRTFAEANTASNSIGQTFEINLRVRPRGYSYKLNNVRQHKTPQVLFSAVATMRNPLLDEVCD